MRIGHYIGQCAIDAYCCYYVGYCRVNTKGSLPLLPGETPQIVAKLAKTAQPSAKAQVGCLEEPDLGLLLETKMHLKIQRRNGREYLSVVQSYRQGAKVKTRTIETIGYADAYADRYEDPIAHFREYVDQLNRNAVAQRQPIELSFGYSDVIDATAAPPARLGAAIALGCLDALGIRPFFHAHAGQERFPPYAARVFEMLATERMMHATSKRESWATRSAFPRDCSFTFSQVYEALPCFSRESAHIDEKMLRTWKNLAGERDMNRIFLICGSYAFPIDGGSRRASVAVAIDEGGMPLGIHMLDGRLEPSKFRESVDELKGRLDSSRAVVVAGGLRDLGPTISELAGTGDGFVLYQRDFESSPDLAAWAEDESGYASIGSGVFMKERIAQRTLVDGSQLPVKEVALRGGGYATTYSHALLVSSELDLSGVAIVQLYRELWRQAEPFQPLEADFSSMPYPTSADDHIRAHFIVCYAAFFALRMLRWKMGGAYNAADTADALLRMEGVHLQRNYYLFNYRSAVTDRIEEATGIDKARRLRTRADLRAIPGQVKKSFE